MDDDIPDIVDVIIELNYNDFYINVDNLMSQKQKERLSVYSDALDIIDDFASIIQYEFCLEYL